jgi:Ca2+-binding RTX toxin-like protein
VAIEAGRGGDGADSMLGNAGDNILAGNAGGDTLDSGAGSDWTCRVFMPLRLLV